MKKTAVILWLMVIFSMGGCMTQTPVVTTQAPMQMVPATTATVPTETVAAEDVQKEAQALQQAEPAVQLAATVEHPGILETRGGGMVIDYSNTQKGYVMVRCEEEISSRLKVQVKGPSTTYTYDLTPLKWTAFPLTDEDGHYQIVIYQNVVDSKYAAVLSTQVEVALEDPFAPFLRSNQYVDFDAAPKTVAMAAVIAGSIEEPLEKVAAIYDYVIDTLAYDKELAATVKSGYLPVLDSVLEKERGICFDYASLMTGMLRSQGIPAKLVVGYAGQVYHAWISVWTESTGWVDGIIFFDGTTWKRMDPTFASNGERSGEIMDFIANSDNYTAKYFY